MAAGRQADRLACLFIFIRKADFEEEAGRISQLVHFSSAHNGQGSAWLKPETRTSSGSPMWMSEAQTLGAFPGKLTGS